MEVATRPLRRAHRRAPRWGWIAAPVAAVCLFVGCSGEAGSGEEATTDTTERTTTTERPTTTEPPTTTTTARPTTTTAPPTTAPPPPPTTAAPPPATEPEPAPSDCDPNYSGCVPNASDVDCAGGSGDGPAYTSGPVQVIGSDVYDLDRDGDGTGCDS